MQSYDTGRTALHHAAETGNADVALLLSKPRAILKAKDGKGRTALHLVATNGHEVAVRTLVELGADINTKDKADGRRYSWQRRRGTGRRYWRWSS